MSFVAFAGKRQREPRQVLRLVLPDGTALHVVEVDEREAEQTAQHTDGAIYRDRAQAIRDTVARSGLA